MTDSQTNTAIRHGSESANELLFLRERWQELQNELLKTERRIRGAQEVGHKAQLLEARWEHLKREQVIIDELFDETAKTSLEQAIGRRLRRLQNAQFNSSPTSEYRHYYSQQYWNREADREILNSLLRDWQAWKRAATHPVEDYW